MPGLFYGTIIAAFYLAFGRRVEQRPWSVALRRSVFFGVIAGTVYAVTQAVLSAVEPTIGEGPIAVVFVLALVGIIGWVMWRTWRQ